MTFTVVTSGPDSWDVRPSRDDGVVGCSRDGQDARAVRRRRAAGEGLTMLVLNAIGHALLLLAFNMALGRDTL
jgi:hypothetical protein